MKIPARFFIPAIPISAVLLSMVAGCSVFSNNSTAVFWTDRPELAAYAELYNAKTAGKKIEVVYQEALWQALENASRHPDLAAGIRLDSSVSIRNFDSLEGLIRRKRLDPSRFYSGLFKMGCVDGRCHVVPVSFSLPAVFFRSEQVQALPDDYIITYEQMRALSGGYNVIDERPKYMGYSPRWQPEFTYNLSLLFGADYSESETGLVVWNDAKVREAIAYAIEWTESTNGGAAAENVFKSKYMYDPLYKLLDSKRILFNFMTIDRYLAVPADMRENLDFRWLSDGKKIIAHDDVLFIGVLKQSKHKKTAHDFISWLFTFETQVNLLQSAQFERMRFFGIAGGLSSLTAVNTDAIPRFFPFVLGHIPHGGDLEFPRKLPAGWELMRDEVVIPWIERAVLAQGANDTLAGSLAQWRLRRPDLYR